jgi:hypothetical protein
MIAKEAGDVELKRQYLGKAIEEYEYSPASEYDKTQMSSRAAEVATLDFDYDDPERDVDLCNTDNGAWVNARVWVPKALLDSTSPAGLERNREP